MKNLFLTILFSPALFFCANAQKPAYFTTNPTISPDAKTIVFSFEGDLWKAGINDGMATRLTAMQGEEINPRISPDGKWLAFSSNQYGNYDVYIMPMDGGDIKQLTYNDANDEVDSWSWDNKTIYFTSGMYNMMAGYKVTINGGTPQRLFNNYFNTVHNVCEHPNGEIFFNDTWESKMFAGRKHYKGDYNPDIQSYNPKTNTYKKYTEYRGKDFWASIDKSGKIYFVSDEGNEEYNLYTFDNGKKTALTKFDTSIKRPNVSANGEKVVFEKDYQLYIFDTKSRKATKLDINILRNNVLTKEQEFDVRNTISSFDVSPDGKKLAFVSRGELFVSDVEGKFVQKLERPAERALDVHWLSDSKTLLFNQTSGGYQNLFTIAADGSGGLKQLTNDKRNNRDLTLNKDRSMAVYLSGRDEVRLLDTKTMNSRTLVKDEIWGFQNSAPSFSPNDEYVLFTAIRNFEQDIFVHHIKNNKTINLTNTGVSETNPVWSPDGKYIFFNSNRTKPSYPMGSQNTKVYQMALDKYDTPYRIDKFNTLFEDKKAEKTADAKTAAADKKAAVKTEKANEPISINVEKIMNRLEQISPSFGNQSGAEAFKKGDKTYVFYGSNHDQGKWATYRTIIEPFEDNKTEKVIDGGGYGGLVEVGGKFYALIAGNINKYNLEANKAEKIDIGYKFSRNLSAEFNQMYYETWANLEENYYSNDMHGTDWKKMEERYATYLPYVTNRSDLRLMLNDMLGELNSSHLGFNSFGAEERKTLTYTNNETGIIFNNTAPYTVDYIVANSNADKANINIKQGDQLVKVNGTKVDQSVDRNFYFSKPSLDKELVLTFQRNGKEFNVNLHPQTGGSLRGNLYDEWIDNNRKRVATLSKDRIAYTYMKNMGTGELETFLTDMVAEGYKKDGLILDLRYNTGGNVHDDVLKFLSQRPYLQWQYRGGKLTQQSNFTPAAKPIVLLINEQSLSDAEMTAAGFKALKLGKIIGTESYRWIIFTSAKGLVDGSSYRLPSWGCYTLDGQDLEKEGVKPDIYIKTTFKDRLEDKDPQIETAVAEILKQLK